MLGITIYTESVQCRSIRRVKYIHSEVNTMVEQDLIDVEVEDDLARADGLNVGGTEAEVEVHIVLSSHSPVTAVLG